LPTKRQITVQEKLQFLADFEALSHGDKGEFLRANGLYLRIPAISPSYSGVSAHPRRASEIAKRSTFR
jgi:hypothetical protein